jgi:hypothetical protein
MNKLLKRGLLVLGIGTGIFLTWVVVLAYAWSSAIDPVYTKADVVRNYQQQRRKIVALGPHLNAMVRPGQRVEIEFNGPEVLPIFHVQTGPARSDNWRVRWDSPTADTLLRRLGWTRHTLQALQTKLAAAGCISIASGEPCEVGYRRSGMGIYYYEVFAQPMSDSVRQQYTRGCQYLICHDRLALRYRGGAVGGDCIERDPK